jgi:hypothetical protein
MKHVAKESEPKGESPDTQALSVNKKKRPAHETMETDLQPFPTVAENEEQIDSDNIARLRQSQSTPNNILFKQVVSD